MNSKAKNALITYVVGLSLAAFMGVAQADDSMEKCYGVAKAGMNDCDDSTTCDKSVIDADPNYYLNVPKGMCNKLVGGMLMNPGASIPSMPSSTMPSTTTTPSSTTTMPSTMPSTTTPDTTTTPSTTGGASMGSGSTGGSTTSGTGMTSGY